MFKFSLNENSCKDVDIFSFIKHARNFYGIDLDFSNIKNRNLRDIRETTEIYDLKVTSIYALNDFSLNSQREFKIKTLPQLESMINVCYKLGCPLILVNPSLIPENLRDSYIPQWRINQRTSKRLKKITKIASAEDIRIGFEYITHEYSSVSSLSQTRNVFEDLEAVEYVGYVLDTLNLVKNKETIDELQNIIKRVELIRIADYITEESIDDHRLWPGKGKFPFKKLFRFLRLNYYRNNLSLKISERDCSKNMYKRLFRYLNF